MSIPNRSKTEVINHAITMKQTTFASLAFERKKKSTRRERFLPEMEKVVPWAVWLAVIKPHCATTGPRRCAETLELAALEYAFCKTRARYEAQNLYRHRGP